jgi:ABC-type nitrate/sulfonate/bicarbonate transport system substrate-binding protein
MASHMASGSLDGFCVGEPWNTLAQHNGVGRIVAVTTDILPAHPDKVLAVTQRWLECNPSLLVPLIRAILRGCAYCEDDRNHDDLAEMLAQPSYLNTPPALIRRSLMLDRKQVGRGAGAVGATDRRARSFAGGCTFPSRTHLAWLIAQMQRWGQLAHRVNAVAIARRCADSAAYRDAAASLGLTCPHNDFPTMTLPSGAFDPMADAADQHEEATEGAIT